jgi:DMSO/TMAO reductase YedYZ molybdopterin-dependent catalytic subunit
MPLLPGLTSYRKAPRNPHGLFAIEGEVERPQAFSYLDLQEVHRYYQVADLSLVDERLSGKAVRLRRLLDLAGPVYGTRFLTIESADGGFSPSVPIAEVSRTALIVYEKEGKPLPLDQGGPARFVVPYHPDACLNVKALGRLVVSRERGRDTRPSQTAARKG